MADLHYHNDRRAIFRLVWLLSRFLEIFVLDSRNLWAFAKRDWKGFDIHFSGIIFGAFWWSLLVGAKQKRKVLNNDNIQIHGRVDNHVVFGPRCKQEGSTHGADWAKIVQVLPRQITKTNFHHPSLAPNICSVHMHHFCLSQYRSCSRYYWCSHWRISYNNLKWVTNDGLHILPNEHREIRSLILQIWQFHAPRSPPISIQNQLLLDPPFHHRHWFFEN